MSINSLLKWLALTLTLLLPMACHHTNDEPVAAIPCTLDSYTITVGQANFRRVANGQFNFNSDNQLISVTETEETTGSSVSSSASKSLTTYSYDSLGFLTKSAYASTALPSGLSLTNTTTYSYVNKRLSRAASVSTSSGTMSDKIETYEYDEQGKISHYSIESGYVGRAHKVDIYNFSAGLLTNINGRSDVLIENGRFARSMDNTGRYEYDDLGRQIRYTAINGTDKTVVIYEYEPAGRSYELADPRSHFKGIPANPLRNVYGNQDYLMRRQATTSEANGELKSSSEATYTYQLNANAYPISQTEKGTSGSPIPTGNSSTITTQFTYRTCN